MADKQQRPYLRPIIAYIIDQVVDKTLILSKLGGGSFIPADLLRNLPLHHPTHENGGADELNVAGLSGELADPQTPKAHEIVDHTATGGNPGDVPTVQADGSLALQAPAGGAVDASAVTYTPAVATDWDGDADPGDVDEALDQLAERVDDIEGAGGAGGPPVDSAPADIYIATTGDDTTGDGTAGNPYLTLAKALSVLPKLLLTNHTVHVADGTYAEGLDLTTFISQAGTLLKITGNTGTPANVEFTGVVAVDGSNQGAAVRGPVIAEFEGLKINPAAPVNTGYVHDHATLTLDRCLLTGGATSLGLDVRNYSTVYLTGNNTISGWTLLGASALNFSNFYVIGAGTLTITGPASGDTTGMQLVYHSGFRVPWSLSGVHVSITGVKTGILASMVSYFQHYADTGSVTLDNASTPAGSVAVYATDCSSWSTREALTIDNFAYAFLCTTQAYIEVIGTPTITNVTTKESAHTGGTIYISLRTAQDDEFESATLAAKWTKSSTAGSDDVDTTWPSYTCAKFTGNQTYNLSQAYASNGGTSVSFTAKFRHAVQANYQSCHVFAWDADESDGIRATYEFNATGPFGSLSTKDGGTWSYGRSTLALDKHNEVYIHLQRDTNTWSVWVSHDGESWWRVGTYDKTFNVHHVEVEVGQGGSTIPTRAGIDWFRRDWLML